MTTVTLIDNYDSFTWNLWHYIGQLGSEGTVHRNDALPDDLQVTAETEDGIVMGMSHRNAPLHGVQFHPESIMSEHGHRILQNFLDIAAEWNRNHRGEA